MKNRWISILSAALGLALAAHLAPLVVTHSEQDDCSFGPVANEQYRRLLAEAKRKQGNEWPGLVRDNYTASTRSNARFDDLTRDTADVYQRIAAMHAIARAMGAEYRTAKRSPDDPYAAAIRSGGYASFAYYLDINRIGFFAPLFRTAVVNTGIYAGEAKPSNPTDSVRYRRGVVSFSVLFPNPLDPGPSWSRSPAGEVCPEPPRPDQASSFSLELQ